MNDPIIDGPARQSIDDMVTGRYDSPLERLLHRAILERLTEFELDLAAVGCTPQVEVGEEVEGHRLDISLTRSHAQLDVECDGAAFHRRRRQDNVRDQRLRTAGWMVARFPGHVITNDPSSCCDEVFDRLRELHRDG